jgi:hypothetical protein
MLVVVLARVEGEREAVGLQALGGRPADAAVRSGDESNALHVV